MFNIMREKNSDKVAGEKRKFDMKPTQVALVGTMKTSFVNFTDISKLLHCIVSPNISLCFYWLNWVQVVLSMVTTNL